MGRSSRVKHWLRILCGTAVLLQIGTCGLSSDSQQQVVSQLVLPQIGSIVSDVVFYFLDNVLVHLTT